MFKLLKVTLFAAFAFYESNGNTHSLGSCPHVDPLSNFNMNKMLGEWFVIQKTSTSSDCITYNITNFEKKPNHYKIVETHARSSILSKVLSPKVQTTGCISVPDPSIPASMNLDFSLDVITTKLIVFMTDYDNYAAMYTCKKYPLFHKWSVEILSRTPNLNMDFVDKVRTRTSSYNIDPFTLSIIKQTHCSRGFILDTASTVIEIVQEKIHSIKKVIGDTSEDTYTTSISTDHNMPIDKTSITIPITEKNENFNINELTNNFISAEKRVTDNEIIKSAVEKVDENVIKPVEKKLKDMASNVEIHPTMLP